MAWSFNKGAAAAASAPAAAPAPSTLPAGQHPLQPPTSALPPAAAAPSPVPPAAAPAPAAAAPVSRRRRTPAAATPAAPVQAAPAPAPAPQPQLPAHLAAPAQPTGMIPGQQSIDHFDVNSHVPASQAAPRALAPLPAGGLMGLLTSMAPVGAPSILSGIIEIGDRKGGEPNIFPSVYLTGGEAGGGMAYDEMNPEGTNEFLPVGIEPFQCVLFSFRLVLLLWPKGQGTRGGPKVRPVSRAIVGTLAKDLSDLVYEAQKRYQMRTRPPKGVTVEPFFDEVGHPSTTLEMLVYDPQAGLIGVQNTGTYDSALETARSMNLAFPNGQLQAVPVIIKPHTWQSKGSKSMPNGWPEHGYQVTQNMDQTVWQAWQQFLAAENNNAELAQAISDWGMTTISDKHRASLQAIANS